MYLKIIDLNNTFIIQKLAYFVSALHYPQKCSGYKRVAKFVRH